ncbi:hypothetical protein Ate01nite_26850 [Actinoplanes teichomyceticus]|nr:hypothetical protein Ate01nite_26850 [Actinoplanes teichomyceticus]
MAAPRGTPSYPGFATESVGRYPGEQPVMLGQAFDLAARETGLSVPVLAQESAGLSPGRGNSSG